MDPYPHLNAPAGGYVFVVTYGRSGSTVLQGLLNAIPGYCIRGEHANSLKHLFNAWEAIRETAAIRGLRGTGTSTGPTHPWYGIEDAVPWDYARGLADVFVREVLRLPPGTRVGGFKEIRYHEDKGAAGAYLDFLGRVFPRARFVINTRDLAAVARSGWWASLPPGRVAAILGAAEREFDAFAARLPERAIRLCYDDYAAAPEALAPLYAFLDEPFDREAVAALMARRLDHPGR